MSEKSEKNKNVVPRHLGIIPDGNRRWAKEQDRPTFDGHRAGVEKLRSVTLAAEKAGVEYLSIFIFSTENWQRAPEEVTYLMDLLHKVFTQEAQKLHENNIKLMVLGSREGLSPKLLKAIEKSSELTKDNNGMIVTLCFNYGGRADIVKAAQELVASHSEPSAVDEEVFRSHLSSGQLPDMDLLVRTSGEQRISNFMLWETAYAELYFPEVKWPDFDEVELEKALSEYARRQRRFGK